VIDKNICVVVIPLYKPFQQLTKEELASIKSSCRELNKFAHVLCGPDQFFWDDYINFYSRHGVVVKCETFDKTFFENIAGYNRLLKSIVFYNTFRAYSYMLIFQTDAYVFKNELLYWCQQKYDYIGAPWFDGWDRPIENAKIIGVGNGGLSLRNISTAIVILKRIRRLTTLQRYWDLFKMEKLLKFHFTIYKMRKFFKIKEGQNTAKLFASLAINEDYFWAQLIADTFSDYKVASVNEAIKFSFETNPSQLFKMNGDQLPFGCHAWEKYEPEFWKSIIAI
jgi:hypothetical protein